MLSCRRKFLTIPSHLQNDFARGTPILYGENEFFAWNVGCLRNLRNRISLQAVAYLCHLVIDGNLAKRELISRRLE